MVSEQVAYLIAFIIFVGGVVSFALIIYYRRKSISEYEAEIGRLTSQLQEKEGYESEIQKLQVELSDLDVRKSELKSEIEELEGVASRHSTDIGEHSQKLFSLTEELNSARAILKKSQEEKEANSKRKKEFDELIKSKGAVQEKIHTLKTERNSVSENLSELKLQLVSVEHDFDLQQHGLYEPLYDFGTAEEYKERLKNIRDAQKLMFREKTAITCPAEWTVQGSRREGQKMITEKIKLMANAFNGCCDSIISKVKYSNISSIEKRINKAYTDINKLGSTLQCSISDRYLQLKFDELHLVHEYQEKLQEEKEERAEITKRLREEERAQRELEKAKLLAEKEESNYQKALAEARKEFESASVDNRKNTEKLRDKITQLEEDLREATGNKLRVLSRAEVTRSGYIYIISNIGSFGKDIYKIGLTRRLDPEDRIRELSGAAVPFRYDVHALIFSEDAPSLENALHRAFEANRVNLVNKRKEFFNCSLEAIKKICSEHEPEVKFFDMPVAEEFRKTKAMRRELPPDAKP
ncbi:MAG: DUF4041 domain-containing protein [Candidatus Poribacteria bacterium]|nr:DUF4041 domain-containing protein [Candidatus Poribacteria bacterium]